MTYKLTHSYPHLHSHTHTQLKRLHTHTPLRTGLIHQYTKVFFMDTTNKQPPPKSIRQPFGRFRRTAYQHNIQEQVRRHDNAGKLAVLPYSTTPPHTHTHTHTHIHTLADFSRMPMIRFKDFQPSIWPATMNTHTCTKG